MAIFTGIIGYSVIDLGFDKALIRSSFTQQGSIDVTPELANVFTSGVASKNLLAGELLEFVNTGQAGVSGLGDLGSEIRFWAGDTFANRASAPFNVDQDGDLTAQDIKISNLFFRRHTWILPFESVDGYSIATGGGSGAIVGGLGIQVTAAAILNAITRIYVTEFYSVIPDTSKNPSIQFAAKMNDVAAQNVYVVWGSQNGWDTSIKNFGFFAKRIAGVGTETVYGVYRSSAANEVLTIMTGIDPNDIHSYRAEITDSGATIKYWVDNNLMATVIPGWSNWTSDDFFSIGVKDLVAESTPSYYWNFVMQQDL